MSATISTSAWTDSCLDYFWPCSTVPASIPTPTATDLCKVANPTLLPGDNGKESGYQWPVSQSIKGYVCITPPFGQHSLGSRLENCCSGPLHTVTDVKKADDISYPATCVSWCTANATMDLHQVPVNGEAVPSDLQKCLATEQTEWAVIPGGYIVSKDESQWWCAWVNDSESEAQWDAEDMKRLDRMQENDSATPLRAPTRGAYFNPSQTTSGASASRTAASDGTMAATTSGAIATSSLPVTRTSSAASASASTGKGARSISTKDILLLTPLILTSILVLP